MFDQEICEAIRWDEIVNGSDMSYDDVSSSLTGPGRIVRCLIRNIGPDHPPGILPSGIGELSLVLFKSPEDAYTNYGVYLEAEASQNIPVVGEIHGWWSEGVAKEYVQSESGGYRSEVFYYAVHENLVVFFLLIVPEVPGADGQEAVGALHEVAVAVLEEVKEHLPCTSLVEPPVPGCD